MSKADAKYFGPKHVQTDLFYIESAEGDQNVIEPEVEIELKPTKIAYSYIRKVFKHKKIFSELKVHRNKNRSGNNKKLEKLLTPISENYDMAKD